MQANLISRNNNFDFLRVVAAIMVIASHSYALTGADSIELFARMTHGQWTLGGVAVATFFMMSGFLIAQSSINSRGFTDYFLKRVLRIFPGLAMSVILCAFVLGPLVTDIPAKDYFTNVNTYGYLHTAFLYSIDYFLPGVFSDNMYPNAVNGSLWTIPYEVLCYIVLGVAASFGALKNKRILVLLLVALVGLYNFLPQAALNVQKGDFIVGNLLELSIYFLIGVVYFVFREQIKFNSVFLLISIFILAYSAYFGGFRSVFLVAGSYVVFHFAFSKRIRLYHFAKHGDLSYGLYIYAFPIQQLVTHLSDNKFDHKANFIISLPVVAIISWISWHMVEKRFIRKKAYFYNLLLSFGSDSKIVQEKLQTGGNLK